MSELDRLTDEALVDSIMALKGYQGDDFGDDLVSRLEVLSILSRRAAQAAPSEEWEACTCGPCPLHPAAPAPSEVLREALKQSLWLAVATLAFHGRDRGTDRQERMLDDLEELARKVDDLVRAAQSSIGVDHDSKPLSASSIL